MYGYPKAAAFKVAYDTVKENLDDDVVAYIVMFEKFNPLSDGDYGRLRDYVGSEYENAVRERESTYDKMACLRKMYRPFCPNVCAKMRHTSRLRGKHCDGRELCTNAAQKD